MTKKILDFLNHERYQMLAVTFCFVLIFSGICCESKTQSLFYPDRKVTRTELAAEVDGFISRVDTAYKHLDRQDEGKALLYDQVVLWSTTGAFNPAALIPLVASILGVGAIADNVRKRRDIKKLNNAGKSNGA